jgi:hypothetical protein
MRVLRRRPMLPAVFLLAALVAACSSSPSNPVTAPIAVLSITVTPSPLTPVGSGNVTSPWQISFKVVLEELAGLGGQVQLMEARVYEAATGTARYKLVYDYKDLIVYVGSDRIQPRGTLEVPLQITYSTTTGASLGSLVILVDFLDDKGTKHEVSLLTPIL